MPSILVIGSTGFLGRSLAAGLRRTGRAFDTLDRVPNAKSGASTAHDYRHWPEASYDVIFLIAAYVPTPGTYVDEWALAQANVELPAEVARRYGTSRILHVSSVSVYGTTGPEPVDESGLPRNPSAYGASKRAGEAAVERAQNHCILRFSSLYGPGMKRTTFLPRIVDDARSSRRIRLHGSGERLQNYVFIDDAVGMLLTAADHSACGTFNAVASRSYSNREVAELVAGHFPGCEIVQSGVDTSSSAVYSRRRWDETFPPGPETPLADGIARWISEENEQR